MNNVQCTLLSFSLVLIGDMIMSAVKLPGEASKIQSIYVTHGARNICMTHAPHSRWIHAGCARHIRESDANVARTCRARSAQQEMVLPLCKSTTRM
jgi:hypothetical protein